MYKPIKFRYLLLFIFLAFHFTSKAQNIIYSIAGNGYNAGTGFGSFCCDGQPPLLGGLNLPTSVAIDKAGNIYIADYQNNRIREIILSTGNMYTVAGNGTTGFSDTILATNAKLSKPSSVFVDDSNNIYIADNQNNRIRKVQASTGKIYTIAGTGFAGYSGDGALATTAKLKYPFCVFLDKSRNIFIVDQGNHAIRKIDATTGKISTIAGTGTPGFSGDSALATSAKLSSPAGIWVDTQNNIYISDHGNNRVRKIDGTTNIITTIAGNGGTAYFGDGGPAVNAKLNGPTGLCLDSKREVLYIADQINNVVRSIDLDNNIINTFAGNGSSGYSGDSSLATNATLRIPTDLTMDKYGNLYIADQNNDVIRKVVIDYSGIVPIANTMNSVYPNPSTTGVFNINFQDNIKHLIFIYNTVGIKIIESVLQGSSRIDLSNQPTGIYFLQVFSDQNISIQKIVINK